MEGNDVRKYLPPGSDWLWHSQNPYQLPETEDGEIIKSFAFTNKDKSVIPFQYIIRDVWKYFHFNLDEEKFNMKFNKEGKDINFNIAYNVTLLEIDKHFLPSESYLKIQRLTENVKGICFRIMFNSPVSSWKNKCVWNFFLQANDRYIEIINCLFVGSNQSQFSQKDQTIHQVSCFDILRNFWWCKNEYLKNEKKYSSKNKKNKDEDNEGLTKTKKIKVDSNEVFKCFVNEQIKHGYLYIESLKSDKEKIKEKIHDELKRIEIMKELLNKESDQDSEKNLEDNVNANFPSERDVFALQTSKNLNYSEDLFREINDI